MKRRTLFVALIIFAGIMTFAQSVESSGPQPEYWPVCANPQNIAPAQFMGGPAAAYRSSMAWNGKDYGTAWMEYSGSGRPYFRRFFADGTPNGPAVIISTMQSDGSPKIVWNGNGYGVAWKSYDGSYYQVYFARLDMTGNIISGPTKVSFAGMTETAHSFNLDMAWSGSGYCVVWTDARNGNNDIFATLLDNSGEITYSDTAISTASSFQDLPRIAWSTAQGGMYQIVWMDYRSGTEYQIYGDTLSPDNWTFGWCQLTYDPASYFALYPVAASMGNGMGMAWDDTRDGNEEIYFARLDSSGCKLGSDLRITNNTNVSTYPAIVWTGAEFGLFWQDNRTGNFETWFQRISPAGATIGGNIQVTGSSDTKWPDAAFAKYGYGVTGANSGGGNYINIWGCAADTTPPSCPDGLAAYGISGTTATIDWVPSLEYETDIAYYEVYRNGALLARTSSDYYNDLSLSPNTTYQYYIRAVNAAGLGTTGCTTNTIYTKTNASFTLLMDKSSDPSAHLYWNDGGLNNYSVFRGTSPQVMSQIGSTSGQTMDDGNVLLDRNNYFYTVDDPGE
jgi:hypothetical protein